jgi:hypothetical protein
MASLNQIVGVLSERANRTFDVPFQEELKTIIGYWRARIVTNSLKNNPHKRKRMQQSFVAELELVPKVECPVEYGCVLRTICDIPDTIVAGNTLFDYVGLATWDKAFSYTKGEFETFLSASPYTGGNLRYEYKDNKIYIYTSKKLKYIGVRSIFTDPRKVNDCHCGEDTCYDDDEQYPLSEELVQEVVKSILATELRAYMPQEDVDVQVNPEQVNASNRR